MVDFSIENILSQTSAHTYQSINFGCRVNASEVNFLSQIFINYGLSPTEENADVYLINTCAITKKGEYESLYKIKKLSKDNPHSIILATGCANLEKIKGIKNVFTFDNHLKEQILKSIPVYSPEIKDKFSHTQRYVLRVQSGCTTNCTFCIVPSRRSYLNSVEPQQIIDTIKKAVVDGYKEVIITGVNLAQYFPGFSNLIEEILTETSIELVSFGSVPVLCIDDKFINLYHQYPTRLSHFLHIPLQSCSDKILRLMKRPYTVKRIKETFAKLKNSGQNLSYGTDIIVGFPTEDTEDFQATYNLCQEIGFSKLHVFKYSPRPNTAARELFLKSPKLPKTELSHRSIKMISLNQEV